MDSSRGRIVAVWCEVNERKFLQGYLTHQKRATPWVHHRDIDIGLL
jgi:hypothetical protein